MPCKRCGECCKHLLLKPEGFNYDFEWMEIQGGKMVGEFAVFESPCPKLIGNLCSIYETRPPFCRWWPGDYDAVDLEYLKSLNCTIFED